MGTLHSKIQEVKKMTMMKSENNVKKHCIQIGEEYYCRVLSTSRNMYASRKKNESMPMIAHLMMILLLLSLFSHGYTWTNRSNCESVVNISDVV